MFEALTRIESLEIECIINPTLTKPKDSKLRSIKVVKIYYCLYGRNAWHSTWVQKYSEDCMHTSFESAILFAESRRAQGSVFYIMELPALCIEAGDYNIFVTQINENCPLREYSAKALRSEVGTSQVKIEGCRDNYLTFGAPINGVISSFEPNSRFWRTVQPLFNSTFVLYSTAKTELTELKTTKLKGWKSIGRGRDHYLSWLPFENKVRQSSVLRLYNQSGFNLKKPVINK